MFQLDSGSRLENKGIFLWLGVLWQDLKIADNKQIIGHPLIDLYPWPGLLDMLEKKEHREVLFNEVLFNDIWISLRNIP